MCCVLVCFHVVVLFVSVVVVLGWVFLDFVCYCF